MVQGRQQTPSHLRGFLHRKSQCLQKASLRCALEGGCSAKCPSTMLHAGKHHRSIDFPLIQPRFDSPHVLLNWDNIQMRFRVWLANNSGNKSALLLVPGSSMEVKELTTNNLLPSGVWWCVSALPIVWLIPFVLCCSRDCCPSRWALTLALYCSSPPTQPPTQHHDFL